MSRDLPRTSSTKLADLIERIEKRVTANGVYLGQREEEMFFSVMNYKGKIGKVLFDNPAEYARSRRVILDPSVHDRFKERVRGLVGKETDDKKERMVALNPTWRSYKIESQEEYDEFDQAVEEDDDGYDDDAGGVYDQGGGGIDWSQPVGCWAEA